MFQSDLSILDPSFGQLIGYYEVLSTGDVSQFYTGNPSTEGQSSRFCTSSNNGYLIYCQVIEKEANGRVRPVSCLQCSIGNDSS